MAFTDDKLKVFKRRAEQCPQIDITSSVFLDLIARLEAAEACCGLRWDVACNEGIAAGETGLLKRWRKAAGKGV